MSSRTDREELFAHLSDPGTAPLFFDRVADDVSWTVQGTHPLAGHFTSKSDFTSATIDRLSAIMRDGFRFEVKHVFVDGDVTIVEMQANSTTLEGSTFDGTYCWVCRFDSPDAGARIVEVRAYLDSAMIGWVVNRNEKLS
ncbi:nuclear transport factor 2 family protein [Streptomyces griseoluteus]|uniref:nuclear transport factor 2 family protein n=1 Tax=Streptomyces griseoluteus TaxID=29306 RepID=UPI003818A496